MPDYSDAVVWYHASEKASTLWWITTAAAIAHPSTRRAGWHMASFGARVAVNTTAASARAFLGTTLVRGGTMTVGAAGAQAFAAAFVPLVVGYAASDMIAGQRGRTDYVDFITGQVSPRDYWDAVTLSSMR